MYDPLMKGYFFWKEKLCGKLVCHLSIQHKLMSLYQILILKLPQSLSKPLILTPVSYSHIEISHVYLYIW